MNEIRIKYSDEYRLKRSDIDSVALLKRRPIPIRRGGGYYKNPFISPMFVSINRKIYNRLRKKIVVTKQQSS